MSGQVRPNTPLGCGPNQHYTFRKQRTLGAGMTELELRNHIATLQRWLDSAWRRLSDPALTRYDRRELRNQMKQADAALRKCLGLVSELKSAQARAGDGDDRVAKPDLRFLA